MDTTSLSGLIKHTEVELMENGISLQVSPKWVVQGEDHLSYTTMIRLVECCREYHWRRDVLDFFEKPWLDSTTKSIMGDFKKPVHVHEKIDIIYEIEEIRRRGYRLCFIIIDSEHDVCAKVIMVFVFIDSERNEVVEPPRFFLEHLAQLRNTYVNRPEGCG